MKYNQYAYLKTDYQTKINELLNIKFLKVDWEKESFASLLKNLFENCFAQATTSQAKEAKLNEYAVSETETLADFISKNPTNISRKEFYNVALQLLNYHVGYDFSLTDPLDRMKRNALPFTEKEIIDKDELINVFYRLLNTRAKNGQTLIDNLAGKGYFTQFYPVTKFMYFNGKALPVFDTSKVIREVVYVESDLDTDEDGKSDLLQVTIFRPIESNTFKIPALYTADPYFGGIIDNANRNHNVDVNLEDATTSDYPNYEALPKVKASLPGNENHASSELAVHKGAYSLNEYLLARGFANVYAGAIGTRGSDGLRITGAPEETIAAKEIIEWLHGDRIAYTDRNRTHQTKASWCNGNIGMTGRSYLGTLQIAVATTGVAGLKTVVSEAAISSWYDYYREHGLVVAPEACQGEDLDMLAETCQSNLWDAGNYLKIKPKFDEMQKKLLKKADRETGQYSDFWEVRNYRHHLNNVKCSWISVHGLNDWNVKPKNVYKLWQKIAKLPIAHKLFLHQGPHYNMNNLLSIDFSEMMNLWFCHELLKVNNNAYKQWETVMIQDNLQPDIWHEEPKWNNSLGTQELYYPNAEGELLKISSADDEKVSFTDVGGKVFKEAKISEKDWEYEFISGKERWADQQLRFITEEFINPITVVGRPKIKIRVSSSLPKGQISVALVELGKRKRLTRVPKLFNDQIQELGYRFGTDILREYVPDKFTEAKLITKGHMNIQNYADMKKAQKVIPEKFYDLEFFLQPTFYRVPVGSCLGLIIYSTDQAMTKRPLEEETYTIDLTNTVFSYSQM
ncbi:Xaa-Pro dipeptidyl-peptidase [Lactobacillus sp. PV037]|uniref:Xaa-Pro dipeptidyl-peptidase n=1 Tax=unclassified Lactobacillus TaxID=2620435 RepID=UPI00223F69D7|nr:MULTISPECIES: Xaa-Pro dipeptidyl-peptidase [unclassified Lactobacillus]QNQ82052.1 Xaa-Pro dipeptidyl-peptidase [Lactobacillus sp. PV012]QNQ83913.1 Xaa-Pro dipeptidyl-peptidase [Lactobacillus sp. PV037]